MKVNKLYIENLFKDIIEKNIFIKGSISNPVNKKENSSKINLKLIKIKNEVFIQLESFKDKKAFHENIYLFDFIERFSEIIDKFKQILLITQGSDFQILKGKNTYSLKETINNRLLESLEHNKKKKYIIEDGNFTPFLIKLGIMGEDGLVFKNSYAKFKQINKYLEFIDDTIKEMQNKKLIKNHIKIIDFGCGKSYLTFALQYYLNNIKEFTYEIIGLDLKKDVVEKCNKIVQELNCQNLEFLTGDIKDFNKLKDVDMVFSLHACNNATDYALLKGLELGAKAILAVPCCQHEFNEKMSKNKNSDFFSTELPLGKHGILFEKFTSLATDAFRAQALELCGFKTQVMEFIDMEHTPKNILIKAIKEKISKENLEKNILNIENSNHILE
ncbi:biotin biosynthesis protein BioC [Fusobacterium necrogenes]|uniref:Biotin biosynthesis protein BioC n=1 Tax=Fusobacterium necrogenes TaxID=858 RepID=A0A377GXN8_9FUSO|nr:SAM-dependent methyltransferase [Fusobacterium necrogenes]STO31532.1 biotin biosynthesis protein BioC [Fusobacterium necrogenes]